MKNNTSSSLITRTLHTSAPLLIRESGDGEQSRTITGYAILFDTPSAPLYEDEDEEVREVIAPEAVTRDLLDRSDIKMTMFHDMQLLLARSKDGQGTLTYDIDERGVSFSFDAPNTVDGDKALELVRRGIISGCSFMFTTYYRDKKCVERTVEKSEGKNRVTCRVKTILGIYDFTLTPDPAYPATSCEARDLAGILVGDLKAEPETEAPKDTAKMQQQWLDMQRAANQSIFKPKYF